MHETSVPIPVQVAISDPVDPPILEPPDLRIEPTVQTNTNPPHISSTKDPDEQTAVFFEHSADAVLFAAERVDTTHEMFVFRQLFAVAEGTETPQK